MVLDRAQLVLCPLNGWCFAARIFGSRRGASDEHIPQWICKERATKPGRKALPPFGVRPVWLVASLLVGHSPTAGDARSSRLATGQTGRNKTPAIQETQHWGESKSASPAGQIPAGFCFCWLPVVGCGLWVEKNDAHLRPNLPLTTCNTR